MRIASASAGCQTWRREPCGGLEWRDQEPRPEPSLATDDHQPTLSASLSALPAMSTAIATAPSIAELETPQLTRTNTRMSVRSTMSNMSVRDHEEIRRNLNARINAKKEAERAARKASGVSRPFY